MFLFLYRELKLQIKKNETKIIFELIIITYNRSIDL